MTVKELADAEAARAEADPPDEDEPTPPDAEPQPDEGEDETPPEPAPTEPSAEAQVKLLDQAMRRFEKALAKIFGTDQPLQEAPFDGVIGYVIPGAMAMQAHTDFQRCQTCNGHGRVLTGSMRQGEETRDCPDKRCAGRGYWSKPKPPEVVAGTPPAQVNGAQEEWETPAWMGDPSISSGPTPYTPPPALAQ
jgi:hypothetical protein